MKTPPGEKERRGGKGVGKGGGKEKPMSYAPPSLRGGGGEVGGEVGLGVDCNGNGGNGTGGFGDFGNGNGNGGNGNGNGGIGPGNGGNGPGVGGKKEKKEEDTESVGSDGKRKRSRSELNEIEKERMSRISQLIGCLHNLLEVRKYFVKDCFRGSLSNKLWVIVGVCILRGWERGWGAWHV